MKPLTPRELYDLKDEVAEACGEQFHDLLVMKTGLDTTDKNVRHVRMFFEEEVHEAAQRALNRYNSLQNSAANIVTARKKTGDMQLAAAAKKK